VALLKERLGLQDDELEHLSKKAHTPRRKA
jgi:hypothetical protein